VVRSGSRFGWLKDRFGSWVKACTLRCGRRELRGMRCIAWRQDMEFVGGVGRRERKGQY
jgi:hypothetical protein